MTRNGRFLAVVAWVALAGVPRLADLGSQAATWRAGAARQVITPAAPMWMAGYAHRDRPSEGTLTELWAKALVLEDHAGHRAVLVTLDLIGIDRQLSQAIRSRLCERFGLATAQIALCTSHTHSGPVVAANLRPLHLELLAAGQRQLVEDYAARLPGRIEAVVGEALDRVRDCDLSWGSGRATFAANRRENREADVARLRAQNALAGPCDHDVPVLAIRDGDEQLVAVVFGYACHATVLDGYQWCGDYPGYAQQALESAHRGCVALFWAGCGGDQNPLPRRRVELARQYGDRLAAAVQQVLEQKLRPVSDGLKCSYREIDLPLGPLPARDRILADSQADNRFVAARARYLLRQLDETAEPPATYPYPVGVWEMGQVQLVLLGGEVVVDYALRLKSELAGPRTWVAAYANDVMAYIPSRRVLAEGGYEGGGAMVYYGLPTVWSPAIEELIVDQVRSQVTDLATP
jgi:hypothetical protein